MVSVFCACLTPRSTKRAKVGIRTDPVMQHDTIALPERNLDYLRTFAVLLVFMTHLTDCIGLSSPFIRWMAQAGVLAFFVHTALVLMSSLERDGAPARPHWVSR